MLMERGQRVLTMFLSPLALGSGYRYLVLLFGGMLCSLIVFVLIFNNSCGFPEARVKVFDMPGASSVIC